MVCTCMSSLWTSFLYWTLTSGSFWNMSSSFQDLNFLCATLACIFISLWKSLKIFNKTSIIVHICSNEDENYMHEHVHTMPTKLFSQSQ